jgi:hypothetical protein
MSTDKLLDFAVAHELGHALCNEKNELAVERIAMLLRTGASASCGPTLLAKTGHTQPLSPLTGRGKFD